MPQSQTAANPRHQEQEKKDKNIHAQNKQMYEKHEDQLPFPKRDDQNVKTNGESRAKSTRRL